MTRAVVLKSLVLVCLSSIGSALGQSDDSRRCPFNITGLWRSDTATEMTRIFFDFSPEGHVTLLDYSPDTLPQDFEAITSVGYKLDKPDAPRQIDFTAMRGNDVFPKGVASWKVISYGDDRFTTLDPVSGRQTQWVRETTHRYFLTFAGRGAPPSQGGTAFVMWTVMDGRETKTESLGVQVARDEAGKVVPTFGLISTELCDQIIEESERDKKSGDQEASVIARFELNEAEFESTHQVYQTWEKYVTTRKLPAIDPYANAMEFLGRAAEALKQCGDKIRINRPTRRERDEILAKRNPPQQPLEYIRITRRKNEERHVTNSMYPWVWRPQIQQPED